MKKQNFRHIAVTVTLSNIDTMITMISINTTENNDDRGRQYRIVICFRDHGSMRGFVCELFPITRINQFFLLMIKCKKSSFRTHEAVDIASDLFRSSWFLSGLTYVWFTKTSTCINVKKHRLCFLCMMPLKYKQTVTSYYWTSS